MAEYTNQSDTPDHEPRPVMEQIIAGKECSQYSQCTVVHVLWL